MVFALRLFVIKKCPYLLHEMVQCVSQLILLAHAGRIGRLPSLDTIEYVMKCSPMIVQAMWEKSSPVLQVLETKKSGGEDVHCTV